MCDCRGVSPLAITTHSLLYIYYTLVFGNEKCRGPRRMPAGCSTQVPVEGLRLQRTIKTLSNIVVEEAL